MSDKSKIKNSPQKWDKFYAAGAKYRQLNQFFLDRLIGKVEKMAGKKINIVIDLGCGNGAALAQFKERGYKSIGVDFSSFAIREARKRNLQARFINGDLTSLSALDIPKGAGLILCNLTVAFIKNKGKFFTDVKKLMSKKSTFCIITSVLHDGIDYGLEDKPGIAVNYKKIKAQLRQTFRKVIEFNNDYVGLKTHIVTFLATK